MERSLLLLLEFLVSLLRSEDGVVSTELSGRRSFEGRLQALKRVLDLFNLFFLDFALLFNVIQSFVTS